MAINSVENSIKTNFSAAIRNVGQTISSSASSIATGLEKDTLDISKNSATQKPAKNLWEEIKNLLSEKIKKFITQIGNWITELFSTPNTHNLMPEKEPKPQLNNSVSNSPMREASKEEVQPAASVINDSAKPDTSSIAANHNSEFLPAREAISQEPDELHQPLGHESTQMKPKEAEHTIKDHAQIFEKKDATPAVADTHPIARDNSAPQGLETSLDSMASQKQQITKSPEPVKPEMQNQAIQTDPIESAIPAQEIKDEPVKSLESKKSVTEPETQPAEQEPVDKAEIKPTEATDTVQKSPQKPDLVEQSVQSDPPSVPALKDADAESVQPTKPAIQAKPLSKTEEFELVSQDLQKTQKRISSHLKNLGERFSQGALPSPLTELNIEGHSPVFHLLNAGIDHHIGRLDPTDWEDSAVATLQDLNAKFKSIPTHTEEELTQHIQKNVKKSLLNSRLQSMRQFHFKATESLEAINQYITKNANSWWPGYAVKKPDVDTIAELDKAVKEYGNAVDRLHTWAAPYIN